MRTKTASMHKELRCLMYMKDIMQHDLADKLGRAPMYISSRMTGKIPWTIDEVYAICDYLEIDYSEIAKYFPRRQEA